MNKMPAKTLLVEQGTQEWHDARRTHVGASEVAAVLGLSKFMSALQLYNIKRGTENVDETWPMKIGKALESGILQLFRLKMAELPSEHPDYLDLTDARWLGNRVLESTKTPCMLVSLDDAFATQCGVFATVDAKNSAAGFKRDENGEVIVPDDYIAQAQAAMYITGATRHYVCVLERASVVDVCCIREDKAVQEMLAKACEDFAAMVKAGTPPEPQTAEDYRRRVVVVTGKPVAADDVVSDLVAQLAEMKKQRKALEDEFNALKERLYPVFSDGDTLLNNQGKTLATFKASSPRCTLDTDALQKEMPEVYARFARFGKPSRTLLIK